VYDCNKRELENLYKSSYNEYLSTKADIKAREQDRALRGDPETLARRFEQRRAASAARSEDDFSLPERFNSVLNNNSSDFNSDSLNSGSQYSSRVKQSSSHQYSSNNSLNGHSDTESIERRLERLGKLREELGLPKEVDTGNNLGTSSIKTESIIRSRRGATPNESSSTSTYERSSLNTSSRSDGGILRSPRTPRRDVNESKVYSSKIETSSGFDQPASSSTKRTTFKSSVSNGDHSDDFASFESSLNSKLKSRKRVEKPSLDGIDFDFDDEALLQDMRRKIPSSSEILEKVRQMND